MTVTYSREVFTSTGTSGIFLKLLTRWQGSIYKLIWHDLLIYIVIYYILSCVYRFALDAESKDREWVIIPCNVQYFMA